ncbi:MAG: hypothetical protein ACREDK_09405 [Thermoplasmata archaeon]
MTEGASPERPAAAGRPRNRTIAAVVVVVAVFAVLGVVVVEELPGLLAPSRTFHMTGVQVTYVGSGATAMCTASSPGSMTCQNGTLSCTNGSAPCAQPLRTGQSFSDTDGVSFTAVLSDTFDCNYTYSVAQVTSASGAFQVSGAAVNGQPLPVNLGFTGPDSTCLTNATITVGFDVGDQGPTDQTLDLNVQVTQELR